MPTARLGDYERENIKRKFSQVVNRARNNKPFPLSGGDIEELGLSMLDTTAREHYEWLRNTNRWRGLTTCSSYVPDFKVRSKTHVHTIQLHNGELPEDGLTLPEGHPHYADILEWAEFYDGIKLRISDSMGMLNNLVYCSSSIGQVKRVLTDEVLRFVPDSLLQSLGDAERKSRVPAGFTIEPDRIKELADLLALGSLSPENRQGMQVSTGQRGTI